MKLNMQNMLQQAQKMQQELEKVKTEISQRTVTADSGGGMVIVTAKGNHQILSIKINKEIVNPDDIEMLEDLVVAGVNKAFQAAQLLADEEFGKVSSLLPNLPGLDLNL